MDPIIFIDRVHDPSSFSTKYSFLGLKKILFYYNFRFYQYRSCANKLNKFRKDNWKQKTTENITTLHRIA